jgi:hypothetical protein
MSTQVVYGNQGKPVVAANQPQNPNQKNGVAKVSLHIYYMVVVEMFDKY